MASLVDVALDGMVCVVWFGDVENGILVFGVI
jgi:hypothetical protein